MNEPRTIGIERCSHCGQTINKREIGMYKGLVFALWQVFLWCKDGGIHEFHMKDVRHLLDKNAYARFGDWVMFGGLVYKHSKAHYGINFERCEEFFREEYLIPTKIYKDPLTGELEKLDYKNVRQIPRLDALLNSDQQYVAVYRK